MLQKNSGMLGGATALKHTDLFWPLKINTSFAYMLFSYQCSAKENCYFKWRLFCISRKNLLYPVSEEVESSSCCPSHFSAEMCFALKVPGEESCQVKKIY